MGQSLQKLAPGSEGKKVKEIGPIIENCYDRFFADPEKLKPDEFYHAVCQTVEEINIKLSSTQFRIPSQATLVKAFERHHEDKSKSDGLSKEDFHKMLQDVILETGVYGTGAKDILFYIFGVPVTTFLIKQRTVPKAIPNEIFIPLVTSATVFILAKLNKI
ncbi:hypothetical protein NMG60_11003524 [Bertholletia excelsa]